MKNKMLYVFVHGGTMNSVVPLDQITKINEGLMSAMETNGVFHISDTFVVRGGAILGWYFADLRPTMQDIHEKMVGVMEKAVNSGEEWRG